jgi:hypothetical protein
LVWLVFIRRDPLTRVVDAMPVPAVPDLSGWLLSAVPALAFIALTKLVLSTKPVTPAPAAAVVQLVDEPESPPVEPRPVPAVVLPVPHPNGAIPSGVIR